MEDQFEKKKKEKQERVAKNELHRLRNIARITKSKGELGPLSLTLPFIEKKKIGGGGGLKFDLWLCFKVLLLLAFMHFDSIFNLQLFLSILFYNCFYLVLKRQTKMVNGASIS